MLSLPNNLLGGKSIYPTQHSPYAMRSRFRTSPGPLRVPTRPIKVTMPNLNRKQIVAAATVGSIAVALVLTTSLFYFLRLKQQQATARRKRLSFSSAHDSRKCKHKYSSSIKHAYSRQVTVSYLSYPGGGSNSLCPLRTRTTQNQPYATRPYL
jgi:hypothetical protein